MNISQLSHIIGTCFFSSAIYFLLYRFRWWKSKLTTKQETVIVVIIGAVGLELYQAIFQKFYLVDTIFDLLADAIGILVFYALSITLEE